MKKFLAAILCAEILLFTQIVYASENASNADEVLAKQYIEEAIKHNERGNYKSAIKICNEAIKLDPINIRSYIIRGSFYFNSKQYKRANEDIELANSFYKILGIMGDNLKQQYEQAVKDFSYVIELKISPNFAVLYFQRGHALYRLARYEQAIQDFNKAVKLNPEYAEAYSYRGSSYSMLKQEERSIKDFNRAIKLKPNDELAYYGRGVAWFALEQYEQAVQDLDKAIKLNPNFEEAYVYRGGAYYGLGNFTQAIVNIDKAIKFAPQNAALYKLRGLIYLQKGDETKAQADFEKAKELGYEE